METPGARKANNKCCLCGQPGRYPAVKLSNGEILCAKCRAAATALQQPERYRLAYGHYLVAMQNWQTRRAEFIATLSDPPRVGVLRALTGVATASALLSFAAMIGTIVFARGPCGTPTGACFVASVGFSIAWVLLSERADQASAAARAEKTAEWEDSSPRMAPPKAESIFDPGAELTDTEKRIVVALSFWPTYPPQWRQLVAVVKARDGYRCQVVGCPSRLPLHVHHTVALSSGGSNALPNLTTVCLYHHSAAEGRGHAEIRENLEHTRLGLSSDFGFLGSQVVRRRLRLVTKANLVQLAGTFGFSCPRCQSAFLSFTVSFKTKSVRVACTQCAFRASAERRFTEDTGPEIAAIVNVRTPHPRATWSLAEPPQEGGPEEPTDGTTSA